MNEVGKRIEAALDHAFAEVRSQPAPRRLCRGLEHAVFPGGARLRPQLVVRVARALGDPDPRLTDAAAAAIELMHCASLVHDDLPCFDDAALRRGMPTVQAAFGAATAVLVGDALMVLGFEALARARPATPARLAEMVLALSRAVGPPTGIIAGQAWESEPSLELFAYHRAKTAALFEGACALGALSARADPAGWRRVGELLGRAYQVADDLADVTAPTGVTGKDVGVDRRRHRPNMVAHLGERACREMVEQLLSGAVDAVPACEGRDALSSWLAETTRGVLRMRASVATSRVQHDGAEPNEGRSAAAD